MSEKHADISRFVGKIKDVLRSREIEPECWEFAKDHPGCEKLPDLPKRKIAGKKGKKKKAEVEGEW